MSASSLIPLMLVIAFMNPHSALEEGQRKPARVPKVVAKGDRFMVHAVPFRPGRDNDYADHDLGSILLHTNLQDDTITDLLVTGDVRINTRRLRFGHSRVAGILAEGDLLHVLVWSITSFDRPPVTSREQIEKLKITDPANVASLGHYALHVFRLSDGSLVAMQRIGGDGTSLPGAPPPTAFDAGPLAATETGVRVGEVEVEVLQKKKPDVAEPDGHR